MSQPPSVVRAPARAPLARQAEGRVIAGVAAGLAQHLQFSVRAIRFALVISALFFGLGILAYLALWVLMPRASGAERAAGLDMASRSGMRPADEPAPPSRADAGALIAGGMVIVGALWAFAVLGLVPGSLLWPVVLGGAGVLVIWLQVDERVPAGTKVERRSLWGRITRGGGAMSIVRLVGGLLLVGAGISWILASQVGLAQLPVVLGASGVLLAGLLIVAAPWLYQQRGRIRRAEAERLRAEARADMAAHLHDSVLQTLALIQRQSHDAPTVATLARRQERELRTWLYGEAPKAETLRSALERIAAEVEGNFPIDVELVCVGDLPVDERVGALVQAVGEAVTNAAKHSGAPRVDVFAEAEGDHIEVFVRDRGKGFDETAVPAGRMGVRQSIRARMERHGGSAVIRSTPGDGTEVRLEI